MAHTEGPLLPLYEQVHTYTCIHSFHRGTNTRCTACCSMLLWFPPPHGIIPQFCRPIKCQHKHGWLSKSSTTPLHFNCSTPQKCAVLFCSCCIFIVETMCTIILLEILHEQANLYVSSSFDERGAPCGLIVLHMLAILGLNGCVGYIQYTSNLLSSVDECI